MALSGKLKDFNVLQLLALIQKTGKTGALRLDHWGQTVTLFFEEGRIIRVSDQSSSLAAALLQAGRIDPERFARLPIDASERSIAGLLAGEGVIAPSEMEEFVRALMTEMLQQLFLWMDGTFSMELDTRPREGDIVVAVDVSAALAGARLRVAEFRKVVAAIPGLDVPLTLAPEAPSSGNLQLTAEEWRLVAGMAESISLRDLAVRLGMDELEIRKVVLRLTTAGLAGLQPLDEPVPEKAQPVPPPSEKSLPVPPTSDPEPAPPKAISGAEAPSGAHEAIPEAPLKKGEAERSGGGMKGFFKLR